ncbi:MAG: LytR/AlgR family response regulator transcription factor [Sphingobacterium composti]|uniref:LytR/AlgR family response regulator transcription factor n=1 Tax=Sphingobacterium composti TaxID=363260 RepID=UPI001358FDB6|nr:LytTR family DNA-binding domain-containing protein [Sphingobacterium composti Ten et al. 2007 non Yoo et al. 2007]
MIRAVVLDDETKGSSLLAHKINALNESIEIVRIFNQPELALHEIKVIELDVLFLDVEMPKINGFEFLERLGSFDFEVIFVTAYNEYVLEALRANALDYLLKPVNPNELQIAIDKLKRRINQKNLIRKSNLLRENNNSSSKLALPTAEGIYFVRKTDIIKVVAMSNYSIFHLDENSSKIIVSKTLKEFESCLEDGNFLRVNRGSIVNLDFIVRYKKGDGGTLELVDGSEIEVSPSKKKLLLDKLYTQ